MLRLGCLQRASRLPRLHSLSVHGASARLGAAARLRCTAAAADAPKEPPPPPPPTVGEATRMEFQAETKKLLDIVAKSLYTDKEVFLRELVSNASDALEKRRHAALISGSEVEGAPEMAIWIDGDKETNTLTITDTGIGMSKEELIENLGTIARSGSKNFLQQLDESEANSSASANVIGQFGVGFYAVFMVADEVTVYSRRHGAEMGHCWKSTGDGSYELAEASGVAAGTKIVIKLKPEESNFATKWHIGSNIRRYSSFIGFPIKINGERVDTVEAIWLKGKNEVTKEQHSEFYRYISQSFDDPRYTLHFTMDAPISIKAIFYIPESHVEKWGMARQESGVNLYCRKVLIEARSKRLLPEWMRFLKGVVDSEDLPLNISRESMQDSSLMQKISSVLSKRVIKFLQDLAKNDEKGYLKFYDEFGQFLKEGVYTDFNSKAEVAKLLRFESSTSDKKQLVSLDDYIGRMVPEQNDKIYWLLAPTRESALSSAYMEAFTAKKIEVLLVYSAVDEFVMTNLMTYGGKSLASAENAKLDVDKPAEAESLDEADSKALQAWFKDAVAGVKDVRLSSRLVNSPAIIVGHESSSVRRMMAMVESGTPPELPPQTIEINASHPIIRGLASTRETKPELAKRVAQQVFSNALITAGLMDDPRVMLNNVNALLEDVLNKEGTPQE
ncbi:hypothetical protein AB1Y20_009262 [Prymnesium parvum]|uniref:Histidine kinase/HSP90-like ATPase domain-containing protein n=1 Tax=Prymnesium parvum TaxID=97485 RepID=A0AB34K0Z7_PRYPA